MGMISMIFLSGSEKCQRAVTGRVDSAMFGGDGIDSFTEEAGMKFIGRFLVSCSLKHWMSKQMGCWGRRLHSVSAPTTNSTAAPGSHLRFHLRTHHKDNQLESITRHWRMSEYFYSPLFSSGFHSIAAASVCRKIEMPESD